MCIKALLVEDDEITALFHRTVLEDLGCKVELATSGEEAINKYTSDIDLILMDIGLPGIDGIETFKKIKEIKGFNKKTTAYACTAFGKEVNGSARKAGMEGVISKPCNKDTFKKLINFSLKKRVESEREVLPLKKEAIGPVNLAQF